MAMKKNDKDIAAESLRKTKEAQASKRDELSVKRSNLAEDKRKTKQAIDMMAKELIKQSEANYKKFGVYTPFKKNK